ncbi:MAG: hypothetical protein HOP10_00035 [Chitinophagaceae bacterium]|nr:hypothetical protein [Chitinophagaceae bacterium]
MLLRKILLAFLVFPVMSEAQVTQDTCYQDQIADPGEREKIFNEATIHPSFKGGVISWRRFLERNLNTDKFIDGSSDSATFSLNVTAKFVVDKTGRLSNLEILNSPNPVVTEEMIRILKRSCPFWNPPYSSSGRAINAWHTEKIFFTVEKHADLISITF